MIRTALGFLLTMVAFVSTGAVAQDYSGQTVASVAIDGLERVSEQVVRSKLEVQAGQAYNARAIARDIRRLYDLGFFTQIKADATPVSTGVALAYVVEEKRLISEIRLVGNSKLKERRLRGVLTMREGDSFIAEAFDEERDALITLYETRGYANATVDITAEKVGPSRVVVTYTIFEGSRARIRSIDFVGNEALNRKQLKSVMKTRRAFWFFGGKYEETKFETDLDAIVDEYGNHGHLEAAIPKTDMTFSPSGKGMNLSIHLSEGPVYHVNSLEVAGNKVYDTDEVVADVETLPSGVHNKGQVVEDAALVQKKYQDSGYVNARVTPQVVLDRENKTTAIVHRIEEGDLKYIKEITITGNTTTKDEVLRRDVTLTPTERFDGEELEGTRRNLENTRYYDQVRLTLNDDVADDYYTNLLVDVDEGKTGTFNFGAGLNSETGIGGFTELKFDNFDIGNWPTFTGAGQQLRIRLALGTQEDSYTLSFTEPEFMGYPLAFGFDVYKETRDYEGGTDYKSDITGGQLRIGKVLSPYLTVRGAIGAEDTTLSDFVEFERIAHPDLRAQEGSSLTISTTWAIERNTIDRFMDPASGSRHTLSAQLAGLGDNYFYKMEQDSIWFWPLTKDKKWVLSYRGRLGFVSAYGSSDSVPIQDRLFVGGTTTVRGYEQRDIGPQAREYEVLGIGFGSEFRQGGNWRAISNLEIKYKVNDIMRVYGFWDAGGAWEYFSDFELDGVKNGVGLGLGFDVPRFGPIRLDYGFAVNPDDDQGSGQLHFSSGFRF